MAKRGREAMNKRARERARQEKAEAKRDRRESRPDESDSPSAVDEAALMEAFARLSEKHAADRISDDEYHEERRRIFEVLGIDAHDGPHTGAADADPPGSEQ